MSETAKQIQALCEANPDLYRTCGAYLLGALGVAAQFSDQTKPSSPESMLLDLLQFLRMFGGKNPLASEPAISGTTCKNPGAAAGL